MLKFHGLADSAARFLQKEQLSDPTLWAKLVDVFRSQPDSERLMWSGEFWGKMMRGATLVYKYTRDSELYSILTESVRDMMSVADADGRVSSYKRERELCGWDMWCRKYVILASEYYLDICNDAAFAEELKLFISRAADYLIERIGEGKTEIYDTSGSWCGINSSSILEPMVKLYRHTGEKKYLDFAEYIVESGAAKGINIFELAYKNELYPYQYGVSKAYELTSCFEGLLEYYLVTGIEKYKTAVINYARAVLDSEISVIGSAGITHELFDHTRKRQTVSYDGVMQETCVTVTWMKFCSRLLELTGDSVYADAMEKSFYNAYLGAINTEKNESDYMKERFPEVDVLPSFMPFDSYSPLTPGKRGRVVGGNVLLPDNSYYGCCACIGSAGVGVFLDKAITVKDNAITVNFFERGEFECEIGGVGVKLLIDTDYPVSGKLKLTVLTDAPTELELRLRNPGWSALPSGYTTYNINSTETALTLAFDMPVVIHRPEHWDEDTVYTDTSHNSPTTHGAAPVHVKHDERDDKFFAVTRGPITLGADEAILGDLSAPFDIGAKCVMLTPERHGANANILLEMRVAEGKAYRLIDYASCGKDWQSTIAAWIPTND